MKPLSFWKGRSRDVPGPHPRDGRSPSGIGPPLPSRARMGLLMSPDRRLIAPIRPLVLMAAAKRPLHFLKGVAQVRAAGLPFHARYVIHVPNLGFLKIRPVEVERAPRKHLILHFQVLSLKRA